MTTFQSPAMKYTHTTDFESTENIIEGPDTRTEKVMEEQKKESFEQKEDHNMRIDSDLTRKKKRPSRRPERRMHSDLERQDSRRVSHLPAPTQLPSLHPRATEGTVIDETTKRNKKHSSSNTTTEKEEAALCAPLNDIVSSTVPVPVRDRDRDRHEKKTKKRESSNTPKRSENADGSIHKKDRKSRSHRTSTRSKSVDGSLNKEDKKSRRRRSSSCSQATAKVEPAVNSLTSLSSELDCGPTSDRKLRPSNRRSKSFRLRGRNRTSWVPSLASIVSVGSQGERVSIRGSESSLFSKPNVSTTRQAPQINYVEPTPRRTYMVRFAVVAAIVAGALCAAVLAAVVAVVIIG